MMGQVRHDQIVSDPEIMLGKPTIKGTRITVELILEELAQGLSVEEVLEAHPHLTKEQVLGGVAVRRGLSGRGGHRVRQSGSGMRSRAQRLWLIC
jgi:uncharacterized protein (DUF433 family)